MKFYKITDGSYQPGKFAFASGFGPVDDLWFLPPQFADSHQAFWRINPQTSGLHIEPNAKIWPDFLGNGNSPPMFFVSERIVESLRAINAPIGRVTEMPIADVDAKALRNKPAPKYYVVETFPGIAVDPVATGFKVDAQGKAILNPPPQPWPSLYHYDLDSWNGTDLFASRHLNLRDEPDTQMLCTERIKLLAEEEGWTNVSFRRLRIKGINPFTDLPE